MDNTEFISLCTGCGGIDLGLEKAGFRCVGQVEVMKFALKILKRHWPKIPKHTNILTLLRSASLVKIYHTQTQKAKVLKAKRVLSSSNVCGLFSCLFRNGYLLRMFPDYFQLTGGKTLELSCKQWPKAGMGIAGTFWTLNTSESPKDAKDCSLLDALEDSVPQKYWLSHKAIAGIIRRTEKYGRAGYVLQLEQEIDKIRHLKRISLQQFKHLITRKSNMGNSVMKATSLHQQSREQATVPQASCSETPLSLIPSTQAKEGQLGEYGKTIILRKLTPNEKERLQGFPEDWTLPEGSSLVTQFQCQSQNGLVKE